MPAPPPTHTTRPADHGPHGELLRPGRSTWGDEASRASLQMLADTLCETAKFDLAVVSIVDDQGTCENVAVAGAEEARAQLLGTRVPLDLLMRQLEEAEVLGPLRFVREQDNRLTSDWGWHADLPAPGDDTAWHTMDWLAAVVHDHQGEVVGLLQLDLPTDGRRPDRTRLADIERRSAVAIDAVVSAREREHLSSRARLALTARNVVRNSSGRQSVAAILASCHQAVNDGFRARGLFFQLLGDEGETSIGSFFTEDGHESAAPAPTVDIAEHDARIGWRNQQVAVVDRDHPQGSWLTMGEGGYLQAFLEHAGLGSLLFVPIGVGSTCLGSMTLTRSPGDPAWSHDELGTALDIGHDLGNAILNARAWQREQDLLEEMRQLDAYKSDLIATVSHELRNPLTAITGHLEIVASDLEELPARTQQSLSAMTRGAERLERIIEDLLLFSTVGDPSRAFQPAEIDLRAVVRDVREMQDLSAAQHQQHLVAHLPDEPVLVRGVPEDLDRVVSNLLSNALKYSGQGATVTLDLRQDEHKVVLSCTDEGLGISETDQERVFGEFFRSEDPDVRRQGGTGLGLAIVGRIVERHRGRVTVESTPGVGSTFRVLLPTVAEFDALSSDPSVSRSGPSPRHPS